MIKNAFNLNLLFSHQVVNFFYRCNFFLEVYRYFKIVFEQCCGMLSFLKKLGRFFYIYEELYQWFSKEQRKERCLRAIIEPNGFIAGIPVGILIKTVFDKIYLVKFKQYPKELIGFSESTLFRLKLDMLNDNQFNQIKMYLVKRVLEIQITPLPNAKSYISVIQESNKSLLVKGINFSKEATSQFKMLEDSVYYEIKEMLKEKIEEQDQFDLNNKSIKMFF